MSLLNPKRSLVDGSALLIVVIAAICGVTMCSRSGEREAEVSATVIEFAPDTVVKAVATDTIRSPKRRKARAPKPPKVYPERSPLDEKL